MKFLEVTSKKTTQKKNTKHNYISKHRCIGAWSYRSKFIDNDDNRKQQQQQQKVRTNNAIEINNYDDDDDDDAIGQDVARSNVVCAWVASWLSSRVCSCHLSSGFYPNFVVSMYQNFGFDRCDWVMLCRLMTFARRFAHVVVTRGLITFSFDSRR